MNRQPEAVRIWLLGQFRLCVGSRTIEEKEWRLRKAASLIKLLALKSGHRIHRDQAMGLLWPDLNSKAASNNLRRILRTARKILEPTPTNTPRYLRLENDLLALCPDGAFWMDVEAFEGAATSARRVRDPAAYKVALELY